MLYEVITKVLAPDPLFLCEDLAVTGQRFFIMERLPGVAAGHRITRDSMLVPDGGRANPDLDPEIRPLLLSSKEQRALAAFLRSLTGEVRQGFSN